MANNRLALLQLNFTVGDFDGNASKIIEGVRKATQRQASLVVGSELGLFGYPARDWLLNKNFLDRGWKRLLKLAEEIKGNAPLLIGVAEPRESPEGSPVYNAAAVLAEGRIKAVFRKTLLPTYDVFDEARYFEPGPSPGVLELGGHRFGITICEDVWNDKEFWSSPRYAKDPLEHFRGQHLDCIINVSASPFALGKQSVREAMLEHIAKRHEAPVVYVNQTGGNDDLVFDGRSCVVSAAGTLIARARGFQEDLLIVDLPPSSTSIAEDDFSVEGETWNALVLGTRDYTQKCGFANVLIGLSGGIDSSLTAAIAVEALGADHVLGILLPSPYSSKGSIEDSIELARRLHIRTMTIPIESLFREYEKTLGPAFQGHARDTTEENIQARIRGNLLMALSNKFGSLLLTTGNKSELAVGYCTLYGDMSGGLAVIADVPKTLVYRVARWLNETRHQLIPESILQKPPSAELAPGQLDQDSLPPYDVLDDILRRHVEEHESFEELLSAGHQEQVIRKVLQLVRNAEFKRKQAAPGIKITDRAFGTGWRMPIAARTAFQRREGPSS